jgi:hypothetical protein
MSASNMSRLADTGAPATNPSTGKSVMMSPFSGPLNSPLDARTITGWSNGTPTYANNSADRTTGALNTGIGFGGNYIIGPTAPHSIVDAKFSDDYTPGVSTRTSATTQQSATTSVLVAIGGGKSTANVAGIAPTVPYTAGFQLLSFGEGGSRDAGAGPAFTGFGNKTVTATATVAVGVAVEAGFLNRSSRSIVSGESVFGSSTTASAAVA